MEAHEYVQADVQRSFIPPKKSKTLVCMRLCCFHQGIGSWEWLEGWLTLESMESVHGEGDKH